MRQLFLIAAGFWLTLAVMKPLMGRWMSNWIAFAVASPIMLIFLILAFFKQSEFTFVPFISKMITTYILDSPRSFQRNVIKPEQSEIIAKYSKADDWEYTEVSQKWLDFDETKKDLDILDKW